MSLLPLLFRDAFYDNMRPHRLMDQQFGVTLRPDDLLSPMCDDFRRMFAFPAAGYIRPWRSQTSVNDAGSTVSLDQEKFQVNLDVQQFKPEEITVKMTGNNTITVEGKHEEKQDEHGYISRHFVRKYVIPDGHDIEKVVSQLSSDGVLSIIAPKKVQNQAVTDKQIPIQQTGAPAPKPAEPSQPATPQPAATPAPAAASEPQPETKKE